MTDTNPEANPQTACTPTYSCSPGLADPIHNFMDYRCHPTGVPTCERRLRCNVVCCATNLVCSADKLWLWTRAALRPHIKVDGLQYCFCLCTCNAIATDLSATCAAQR